MRVEVRLISFLCKYLGRDENRCFLTREIEESSTCADLLNILHIPPNIPRIIIVNGIVQDEKCLLQEGDEVVILPPIEGG